MAFDRQSQLAADEIDEASARIGVTQSGLAASRHFDQDKRGQIPDDRSVRFGPISWNLEGPRLDALDRDVRLHHSFPGRTLVRSSLALFFSTLPSSGSDGIM